LIIGLWMLINLPSKMVPCGRLLSGRGVSFCEKMTVPVVDSIRASLHSTMATCSPRLNRPRFSGIPALYEGA
jgi:hypothetical protein